MNSIKKYNEFIKLNEEEGWKEKALAATMAAGSLLGGKAESKPIDYNKPGMEISYEKPTTEVDVKNPFKKEPDIRTKYRKTYSKEEADKLVSRNWTLDSVTVDTIWKRLGDVRPSADTVVSEIKFNNRQYFKSGQYDVDQEIKDSLSSIIDDVIDDNGVIMGIMVESSTDKQGLSYRLQKDLKSRGYEGNNKGLSKARCESITSYLESIGVDSSIIRTNQIHDAGTSDVEESARYVTIRVVYVKQEIIETPSVIGELDSVVKEKYYLSKDYIYKKPKKNKSRKARIKKTKTKRSKVDLNKCYYF